MRKITKLSILLLASVTMSSAFAISQDDQCPPLENLKALGFNTVYIDKAGNWAVAYEPSQNYGTPYRWSIAIGNSDSSRQVKTKDDAKKLANEVFPTIRLSQGPVIEDDEYDKTIDCYYTNDQGIGGYAETTIPKHNPLMIMQNK